MQDKPAFALFMEMRTGKTATILAEFGELVTRGELNRLLVVAPAGVYRTWEVDAAKHLHPRFRSRVQIERWESKASRQTKNELKRFVAGNNQPKIFLVNIEALSTVMFVRELVAEFLQKAPTMMVIDECFVAGTQVATPFGLRAIETFQPGDLVSSSNGPVRVKRLLRKQSQVLVKVKLADGKLLTVTPNHPFFTELGWIPAHALKGRYVYGMEDVRVLLETVSSEPSSEAESVLRQILLSEMAHAATASSGSGVHAGTIAQDYSGESRERDSSRWQSRLERGTEIGIHEAEAARSASEVRSPATAAWRQRSALAEAAGVDAGGDGFDLDCGTRHRIGREAARLSNLLQSRSRVPSEETGDRVRWQQPPGTQSEGSEKGCQARGTRVDSVTIEEHRDPVDVFDLELEGCPHFCVEEAALVHNSTTIKSHIAARTRFCLTAAPHARRRRILSGLPTPQSPLDIFTQFAFLDPNILGYGTFKPFQYRYAIMKQLPIGPGGRMVQTVAGYQRLDELRAKVKPYAYRVRLDECYDLPPKMYSRRDIELTEEQVRAYAELKAFAVAVLEKTERVTATIVLTQLLRLHQILAGQTKSDDGNVVRLPENRTAETLSVLEEHTGKAIIWVAYHEDVLKLTEVLTQRYGRGAVARFWGGNADTREAEEKEFLTEPKCRFMIATAASGGRGRTWSVASLMIFYQNTFSLEHRLQSEERAQAVGKINSVGIVDLVARDTVEDKILDALRNKRHLSNEMTGDAWKKWVA